MAPHEVDTLLEALHPVRLPPEAAGGLPAEALAALGIGLLLAAALAPVLRGLTARPRKIAAPETGTEEDRIALLHALKRERPAQFAALRPTLYAPGGLPSAERLRAMLRGKPRP
ncbi:hypothetical protein [Rhodovulum marinum]|uniref:Uncharacterized protein n=1 Tax=Rhodovulum marinum TaxID=320662 RepID=A0A4R2PWQ2_9RHOB|nr:hypothetical protein [Rhodovulum marinum]TCP40417.1 hypothetical protein EV662_10725 [Rhodovulum marinum]